MPVAPGTRLGPYEILGPLGAGGMGEVYRARDHRLARDVAVKVLPRGFAADADRLLRFEQEARAAGQLNHPNVLVVYDVGHAQGEPYLVTELLEGETLRARIAMGPTPPRRALPIAIQVAEGLAAAHAKGIAHRDLKPENLFLLRDGRVKILDFGLAKLTRPEPDAGGRTLSAGGYVTAEGAVLGTASYMSPEQVRGEAVDHRGDIFAFGAILHELLTGGLAFAGPTPVERMNAILNADAPELPGEVEESAPGVGLVIRRCLEKDREARFDSARDLAFALALTLRRAAVPEDAGEGGAPQPTYHPLTFRQGMLRNARFAPDGTSVLYSAFWEGGRSEIFWTHPSGPDSRTLGIPDSELLAVSSTGEVAALMRPRYTAPFLFEGTLARFPMVGGAPRELLEGVIYADWSPDGRTLAIVRRVEDSMRLECPAGRVLHRTDGWIAHPRFSPDGSRIAFCDHPTLGSDHGSIAVVTLEGGRRTLTDGWQSLFACAWAPSGREVWFSGVRGMGVGGGIHAVSLDGAERVVLRTPGRTRVNDVSRTGDALLAHYHVRLGLRCLPPGETQEREISWLDWSLLRDMTPDGRYILFDESSTGGGDRHSVYLRATDGSPAVRLSDGVAAQLSPDGKWAATFVLDRAGEITLVPTGIGEPRTLRFEGIERIHWGVWHPDGRRMILVANEQGRAARAYLVDLGDLKPTPFTAEGALGWGLIAAPDGRSILAPAPDGTWKRFPLDGGDPEPVPALRPTERRVLNFSESGEEVYAFERNELLGRICRVNLATGAREVWRELSPTDRSGVLVQAAVAITRDGSAYAYSYSLMLGQLYLVKGLV